MKYRVYGKLPSKSKEINRKFKDIFSPLGYQIEEQDNNIKLVKTGQIESVINELVPKCESLGWNISQELYLEEYRENKNQPAAVYKEGTIKRKRGD